MSSPSGTPGQRGGLFLQIGSDEDARFATDDSALDLLSVRYIVVDKAMSRLDRDVRAEYPLAFVDHEAGIRVYLNPGAFPRAYLSPALIERSAPDISPAWFRATTRSDDRSFIGAASKVGIPSRAMRLGNVGTARVLLSEHDEVRVEVDASRPAVLVLTDTHHDNWNVSVAGEHEPLARVNDVVRGVIVPRGRSTVVFEYRSPARAYGLVVSGVTIVVVLIAGVGRAWLRLLPLGKPRIVSARTRTASDKWTCTSRPGGRGHLLLLIQKRVLRLLAAPHQTAIAHAASRSPKGSTP